MGPLAPALCAAALAIAVPARAQGALPPGEGRDLMATACSQCHPLNVIRSKQKEKSCMTKVIKCRDVGVDCDFEARGQTEQEVMKKCADHARSAHGMKELPAELAAKVKAAIHEEKAA